MTETSRRGLILTGRNAHPILVELADTVTEMRKVKHAYENGILAQRGIQVLGIRLPSDSSLY